MKRMVTGALLLLAAIPAAAQREEAVRAALYVTGAADPEELDGQIVGELEALLERPLQINRVSAARMVSSGLLTPYQAASLVDYRKTNGDVLSFRELELVDGFGADIVRILRPFLSLSSRKPAGRASSDSLQAGVSTVLKGSLTGYGAKLRVMVGNGELAGALKGPPGTGTFHACWETPAGRWTAGDYHVRFGQGLAFWSGFQLSGLSSPEAFSKRANGLTAAWSYNPSGTFRGLAWDGVRGRLQCTAFGFLSGGKPGGGARVAFLGRHGHAGFAAASDGRLSLEGKYGYRGTDWFGECAMHLPDRAWAVLGGVGSPVGEHVRLVTRLCAVPRAYSGRKNGEYAAAAGLSWTSSDRLQAVSATLEAALLPVPVQDLSRKQVKSVFVWSRERGDWKWKARMNGRWRSYEKGRWDGRMDVGRTSGPWRINGRINLVTSERWGCLSYLEGGWKEEGWYVWGRLTFFRAESWADRIYCYERDAPGNFTVPAYYGTGGAISLVGGWKKRWRSRSLKCYLRASWLIRKEKPGQAGLKIQLMWDAQR